jgi:hypothetical protein
MWLVRSVLQLVPSEGGLNLANAIALEGCLQPLHGRRDDDGRDEQSDYCRAKNLRYGRGRLKRDVAKKIKKQGQRFLEPGQPDGWNLPCQQLSISRASRSLPLAGQLSAKALVLILEFQHHGDAGQIQSLGE